MADAPRIVVVGGGITGMTAALAAAEAGARVTHVMGADVMGGLVANVGGLENFAGGMVAGIDLATDLFTRASELGVEPHLEVAEEIAVTGGGLRVRVGGSDIAADRIVVATGARLRRLAVPGAEVLEDRGVSYCGWCDGPLHRGKAVVVVGSGDAALQEALHLAGIAAHVTVLVRGDTPRARAAYVTRARQTANLELLLKSEPAAVLGDATVGGVRVRDRTSGRERDIACAGVFPFIGLEPMSQWLPATVARDAHGAVITDAAFATTLPGVLAAGAVRAGYAGRLDDAVSEARGAVAVALAACRS